MHSVGLLRGVRNEWQRHFGLGKLRAVVFAARDAIGAFPELEVRLIEEARSVSRCGLGLAER
jgi:hypothetical protein